MEQVSQVKIVPRFLPAPLPAAFASPGRMRCSGAGGLSEKALSSSSACPCAAAAGGIATGCEGAESESADSACSALCWGDSSLSTPHSHQ